jgi:hypothetical protein
VRYVVLQCRELVLNPGKAVLVTGTATPATAAVIHRQLLTPRPSPAFSQQRSAHNTTAQATGGLVTA